MWVMRQRLLVTLLLATGFLSGRVDARLTIDITGGVEGGIPIAIVPFGWEEGAVSRPPLDIASVVAADLYRSGRFAVMPLADMVSMPKRPDAIVFSEWKAAAQEALVIGRLRQAAAGRYVIGFQLFDVFKGERLADYTIETSAAELRHGAHRISDIVYRRLTGDRGPFSTRIAYVSVAGAPAGPRSFSLQVADADGYDPQTIVTSSQPILSPAWSPDGKKLAYVSFETGRPTIFIQTLASGARQKVAEYPGINGAPAWSPDGRRLAVTLSKEGNPDIYVLDLATRGLRKLTANSAIDTEPDWSADGRQILFTSNRGGAPQLYVVAATGGKAKRLTFVGDYNARGRFSPDGSRIALVHGDRGAFRIAIQALAGGDLSMVTPGRLDEAPSFAPNGGMILYAEGGVDGGRLSTVSAGGRVRERLPVKGGDVREPAWSPFLSETTEVP